MRSLPMFWNDAWEYHGEYFDFPLRNVIPKPRQKPHPPLWVACSQIETIRMAGRRGHGRARLPVRVCRSRARVGARVLHRVHEALEKLCDYETNPNIAVVSPFMCAPTDEEALAKAEGCSFFQFALLFYNSRPPGGAR